MAFATTLLQAQAKPPSSSPIHFRISGCNAAPYQCPQLVKLFIRNFRGVKRCHGGRCFPRLLLSSEFPGNTNRSCSDRPALHPVGTKADASTSSVERKYEKQISSSLLWRAVKLPIYSVALVPLVVGSAAAYLETRFFSCHQFFLLLLSSILIIAWLNLSNDAYDAETGVDKDKEESVVNITGSQKGVLIAANACLVFGFSGILWGATLAGDVRIAVLLIAAILCGYVYQCPPFRLSYKGLGEPLCFLAFGPLATTAFYLCQAVKRVSRTLQVSRPVMAAAVLIGLTTTLILFCSHFHQIEGDRSIGKISPMVRLGSERGARVVELAVNSLYFLLAVLGGFKVLPIHALLVCSLTYPIARLVKDFVSSNHMDKEAIFMAKYYAVRLHAAFGTALAVGFFLAARVPALTFW